MSFDMVIIGLGYVGMPLAQQAARRGLSVGGFDVRADVVDNLIAGKSHIDDLTDADVTEMLRLGFSPSSDESILDEAEAVVICVPTPLLEDGGPDLGAVLAATKTTARHLHRGMLVVLESTTYPGTTDEEVRPILEAVGLVAGSDFHLAFSPERVDPGNPIYGIENTPKVVGGYTEACTKTAAAMYGRFIDTVAEAKGMREAEMAKLLENTFRHVNIALVNEMARFCHELDIDLWDSIRLAGTKPFGFMEFHPGPGVGGHCIPIDPNYLAYRVRKNLHYPFRFVELAQDINATMPTYVVNRVQELLNEESMPLRGSKILLLGVTYKRDIADQRESPARAVAHTLLARGADLHYHDPHVPNWEIDGARYVSEPDALKACMASDLVVLLQAHSEYDLPAICSSSRRVLDTRGVLEGERVQRL